MVTQEAEHSLESVVRGHYSNMYKYIWTPCLGERLFLRADVGNAHVSYFVSVMKDGVVVGHMPRVNCTLPVYMAPL